MAIFFNAFKMKIKKIWRREGIRVRIVTMQIKREGKSCSSIYIFFTIDLGLLALKSKRLSSPRYETANNNNKHCESDGEREKVTQSTNHFLPTPTCFFYLLPLSLIFLRLDCLCTQLSRSFSWNHPVSYLLEHFLEKIRRRKPNRTVVASATNHLLGVYTQRRLHRIISNKKEVRPVVTRNLQFLLFF